MTAESASSAPPAAAAEAAAVAPPPTAAPPAAATTDATAALATAAAVHPVKSTASTASDNGYPRGHLGHLNDHEAEQLRAFRLALEDGGLYQPGPPPSHDDTVLLYVAFFPGLVQRL